MLMGSSQSINNYKELNNSEELYNIDMNYCSKHVIDDLVESARSCYHKDEGVKMLQSELRKFRRVDNFALCARLYTEIGYLEYGYQEAHDAFMKASEYYRKAGDTNGAGRSLIKVAETLRSTMEADNLKESAIIFVSVAKDMLNGSYDAIIYKGDYAISCAIRQFEDAIYCYLAIGAFVQAHSVLQMIYDQIKNLETSQYHTFETNFLEKILNACDTRDIEEFDRLFQTKYRFSHLLVLCREHIKPIKLC